MKSRSVLLILICSLVLGSSGTVFADVINPSRSDQVASIQTQYNPLFDAQYTRLLAVQKKTSSDANTLTRVKAVLADFLDMRRIIDSSLTSSTSDLDAVKSFAEEESGEFESSISQLETLAAKSKTITCAKGKQVKKVSGLTPKCPKGYIKK